MTQEQSNSGEANNGVRLPMSLVVAVCAAVILAIPSGAAYVGSLSTSVASLQTQVNDFKADVYHRRELYDARLNTQGDLVGGIDNRLTRIEAQLGYIAEQIKAKP